MNTVDMFNKRVGAFASPAYQMHHEQANSPPYGHHNGLRNGVGFASPGSPMGLAGMSPTSSTSSFASPPPPGHMAAPSPQSSASGKSDPPKRLRYWLIDMIESGSIPGLRWEDESKTIFRIPWKHAGKNNWKEEDCRIFKAWAEHRGKYKEGVDKFDPATWKTRLRCALNKLPDIKELKERSQLEGTDPYRVYRLLPEPDRNQEFEIYPRSTWGRETYSPLTPDKRQHRYSGEDGPFGPPRHYPDYGRHQEGHMDTVTAHMHHGNMANYTLVNDTIAPSSEFSRMHVKDAPMYPRGYEKSKMEVVPPPEDDQEYEFQDHSIRPRLSAGDLDQPLPDHSRHGHRHTEVHRTTSNGSSHQRQHHTRHNLPSDSSPIINPVSSPVGSESSQGGGPTLEPEPISLFRSVPPQSQMNLMSHGDASPAPYEFDLYVRYRGTTVMTQHVSNQTGCRIHYGNSGLQHIATVAHELPSHVFGPQDLQQIELVDVEPFATFEKQINLTKHLLRNVQRGLILSFLRDGTIMAKRLCQSRVFYLCPESVSNEPEKLERNKPTKVFDYKNFCSHLKRFAADQCRLEGVSKSPSIEIKISFGQTWSMKNPLEKNLISLVIIPSVAHFLLNKVRERNNALISINNSILDSGPSSDDRLAERVTRDSEEYVDELISQLMTQEDCSRFQVDDVKRPEEGYKGGYFSQDVEMEVSGFDV